MTKIYKLTDPRTNIVMYVGKTYMTIKKRMYAHYDVANKGKTPKDLWIKELKSLGMLPIVNIIEEVDDSIWQDKEVYWVSHYRYLNPNLLNISIGGSIGGVYLTQEKQQQVILLQSESKSRPVYQLNKQYEVIRLHNSCKRASKEIGTADTNINTAARSRGLRSAGGFIWIYLDEYESFIKPEGIYSIDYSYLYNSVTQISPKTREVIRVWSSVKVAALSLGILRPGIVKARCGYRKTYKGFIWK